MSSGPGSVRVKSTNDATNFTIWSHSTLHCSIPIILTIISVTPGGNDTVQGNTADSPANLTTGSANCVICPVFCAPATSKISKMYHPSRYYKHFCLCFDTRSKRLSTWYRYRHGYKPMPTYQHDFVHFSHPKLALLQ